ncbi:hypothetical protein C1645_771035 [Glomus cerebriforme]|uniref:SWIRM domain-containing protein n=1 Tax=Glomus cerebriforme TaxID=658196 RepID=A0A397SV13_9GLOM|nr:hypothetical protein C1645_771035 [Glomus cerebriforme]
MESSSSSTNSENVNEYNIEIPPTKPKLKSKYRMRICDAPPELLEFIKNSEKKNEKPLPDKSTLPKPNVVKNFSTSSMNNGPITQTPNLHKTISKRLNFRKIPYPKKAPSKLSSEISHQVDSSNGSSLSAGTVSSPSYNPIPQRSSYSSKKQIIKMITKTKIKKNKRKKKISERKRKGNSLARVMVDRGLLESTLTPIDVPAKSKIRIPSLPPIQFDELMKNIDKLNLDMTTFNCTTPKIEWKRQPMLILYLPHYKSLHSKEAYVTSTLRLTPIQYLTAKYTLISTARRYMKKSLPFRKSDAQKLLKVDVNKASKLWEFFTQVKWI